ncbi:protein YgfX [Methylococcus sp. ANG]|uniref:protein YgfX n=1 Tax=Methylococcus sp. ANG TaxID=3231903 RepID=UPI003458FD22
MLTVEPVPSRIHSLATCAVGLLACAGIWIAGIPLPAKLGVTMGLAGYAALLRGRRGFGARLDGTGGWSLISSGGETYPAKLMGSSFASSLCVVLHFSTAHGRVAVPVFRDSVDAETYRRLRVQLRCGAMSQQSRNAGLLH